MKGEDFTHIVVGATNDMRDPINLSLAEKLFDSADPSKLIQGVPIKTTDFDIALISPIYVK